MLKISKHFPIMLITLALFASGTATQVLAQGVTLIGEVNDTGQIVADGEIYEVAQNDLGNDLVCNYVSEKVSVTGTLEMRDDMKIITVTSFKVVPE